MSLLDPTIFEPLPAWGTVVFGDHGASFHGWVEQTDIAGASYVSVTPEPGRAHCVLLNARHIERIDIEARS
jgi:hypothetical protein